MIEEDYQLDGANPMINPASRVPQHQYLSDDSIIDLEDEERHHALPRNHLMFHELNFNNPASNLRPMGPGGPGRPLGGLHPGFSFDDGGMDEYDVADERAHLFEIINPDNMTYEELLAL